ncbi:SRPBCC family protein [soil metagenome]
MKRWHFLAIGLSLALVLVTVVGFLLPSNYTVERAISIDAPTEQVFSTIANLNTWPTWSPWQKGADASLIYTFTGEAGEAGSTLLWDGEQVGGGQIILTQTNPADGVFYELLAGGQIVAKGRIKFLDKGGSRTRVGFEYTAALGMNPMERFAGLFADGQVGPQFEAALTRLKTQLEQKR